MDKKNIQWVVSSGLCTSCGICEGICKKKAIKVIKKKGFYVPVVNYNLCNNCGLCIKICSGHGIDIVKNAIKLFPYEGMQQDYYIGRYETLGGGCSNNEDIRYHSASGGLVSQILIYMIENKIIDGALVTGFSESDPLTPNTYIARTKEEILSSRSSKYCPVSFNKVIDMFRVVEGRYIIVGLPCHIQVFRNIEKIDKEFRSKVFGYFGLYCSSNKSFYSQDYILKKNNIKRAAIKKFAYRDDGCLGFLRIECYDGEMIRKPFTEYYLSMRGFFTLKRCDLCIDHYAELADVSFGDLHTGQYIKDKIGIGSFVIRNPKFRKIIEDAENSGVISWHNLNVETLNDSQEYVKRYKKGPGIKTAFMVRRWMGWAVPDYTFKVNEKITIKYLIKYFMHTLSRIVGAHPVLWPLIGVIDKIALNIGVGARREE